MKRWNIIGMLVLIILSIQSCQKDGRSDLKSLASANLATSLKAAVADIVSAQVNRVSTQDIQGVTVEKFDGTDTDVVFHGPPPPRDRTGRFFDFGPGPIRFDMPMMSDCAIVTVSSSTYPKEIIMDYGTGCSDGRGPVKKGKIIIDISDTIVVAGSEKTMTTQDFYIDSMKVDIKSSTKNLGKNSQDHWIIVETFNQKITKPNGQYTIDTQTDTTEWVNGFETSIRSDDIFLRSGSGSLSIDDSIVFSHNIIKPLLFDSCQFITSGIEQLTKNGSTVIIDYGDGTCDNKATVTVNGTSEEIDLFTSRFGDHGKFGKHCHGFGGDGRNRFGF